MISFANLNSISKFSFGERKTSHFSRFSSNLNHKGKLKTNGSRIYTYDAFGKPYIISGSGTLTSLDSATNLYGNTRLYTGREYDKETKLYFNRARYYNPETGRFISRDPIGQNDQINLYTYVANSPLIYTDRMGKEKNMIVGTLRIYSLYGSENNVTDGHGWIELMVGNQVTTYGIGQNWGNGLKTKPYSMGGGSNILKNFEKDGNYSARSNLISLGLSINQSQLNKINNYISDGAKEGYQWGYFSPCTDFASDIWNMTSNIQLQDRMYAGIRNPFGLSTPDALAESIAEVIVNKSEYESSGDFNEDENPYKNIIY